jgi:large subunit ribosomal protein L7/L12
MAITKEEMIDAVKSMTVLELSDLVKALQEEFGVSAAVPVAAAPAAGGGDGAAAAAVEEPTAFNVVLTGAGDKKIQVIKVVREITALGLKEAKDSSKGAPSRSRRASRKKTPRSSRRSFEGEGASVEIKPAG